MTPKCATQKWEILVGASPDRLCGETLSEHRTQLRAQPEAARRIGRIEDCNREKIGGMRCFEPTALVTILG